jgi:hypothetical protein
MEVLLDPSVETVFEIIRLDTGLFEKALAGLTREMLLRRVVPGTNPLIWIAGHLASARFSMATLLGEKRTSPLAPVFGRGAVVPEDAALPQAEEVLAVWREISEVVTARLAAATPEQLAQPSPRRFPAGAQHALGGLTFLAYHEGYHLGQMAFIRKGLGLSGLVDASQ